MTARVSAITTTVVKGLALHSRERVLLRPEGVSEDRCFYLVDDRRRMVNNKRFGALMAVRAALDQRSGFPALTLRFPDGLTLTEAVQDGPELESTFFSREDRIHPVCPELSLALSGLVGESLTLVRADPAYGAADRGREGVVSLVSRASLERLAEAAGEPVDGRRFRMLLEVEGIPAHAEDAWVGQTVLVGPALVRWRGHVGRCRVTQMDPDSGEVTLPTLDLLAYRRGLPTSEPLALGIYGEVLEPGEVRVGDTVSPAD